MAVVAPGDRDHVAATIANGVPTKVGPSALSPDQGKVAPLQPIRWLLPNNLVSPNGTVVLGIFPTSAHGVRYWNARGPMPPQLIVWYH